MEEARSELKVGSVAGASEAVSMAEHVKRWQISGMSKRQYAQANGLAYWGFTRATRRYAPPTVRRSARTKPVKPASAPAMIEIALRPSAEEALEIVLAGGARINLGGRHAQAVMAKLLGSLL